MFYSKVFREEAVARRSRPEPLDGRLQVTAPHEWIVLAGLCMSVLLFLAWGVFGQVERTLSTMAVIVQPGDRDPVISGVSGNVIEVLAEVGDPVEPEQPIARVELPEAERQARITRTIVDEVEGRMRDADTATAAEVWEALLEAARDVEAVERRAGQSIVVPRDVRGTLVGHRLVAGQAVRAGQTVAQVLGRSADAWQAYAFVTSQDAERLEEGMAAEVLLALPEQPGASRLAARVLGVSSRPVIAPAWLADLGLANPVPAHLLRLVLDDPPESLADGADGRVRIVLGQQSPVTLLVGGSG